MEQEEMMRVLLAEYVYWRDLPSPREGDPPATDSSIGIGIGAVAAISNVIAAFHGFPAPWHAKPKSGDGR